MRRRSVIYLAAAESDIEEIAVWYAQAAGNQLSQRFMSAVRSSAASLKRFPFRGRLRESPEPLLRELRWIPVRGFVNHLLFYRVTPKTIEVVRVLHGSRDLERVRFD